MTSPHLPGAARERLARSHAVASVVDGEALTMFGLFGLSWAIPAAAIGAASALGSVLRRHGAVRPV